MIYNFHNRVYLAYKCAVIKIVQFDGDNHWSIVVVPFREDSQISF